MYKVITTSIIAFALFGCGESNYSTTPSSNTPVANVSSQIGEASNVSDSPVVTIMGDVGIGMSAVTPEQQNMQQNMSTMMPIMPTVEQTVVSVSPPTPLIDVVTTADPQIAPVIMLPIPRGPFVRFGTTSQDIDAARLANQATFGANDATIADIKTLGARQWILSQFTAPRSVYSRINAIELDQNKSGDYCYDVASSGGDVQRCILMWVRMDPNKHDFFKQATLGPDQLRQRVAFALSQIYVVSAVELEGTYRHARYHQMLRDRAFSNFRDLLKDVTLSPAMGSYLNMVNNNKADPNENFARELLQLFSIGTCALNLDGTMAGGECRATYDNDTVRSYAFALTGWTYPDGGRSGASCNAPWCRWANKPFFVGPMKPIAAEHDQQPRALLNGIVVPAGRTPDQAVELVLNSIMAHPNVAPFISVRLIRALVTSNPSPAYVARVATAFNTGKHDGIGTGKKGDLQATIAAILLDAEARNLEISKQATYGKLREPVHQLIALYRAFNGYTDGDYYNWWAAGALEQMPFYSPSVFNFYYLDYALPGTTGLTAPEFGITYLNTVLGRISLPASVFYEWFDLAPSWLPNMVGSKINLGVYDEVAVDPVKLVDQLSIIMTGNNMTASAKSLVVSAIRSLPSNQRARLAGFYIAISADAQIQR